VASSDGTFVLARDDGNQWARLREADLTLNPVKTFAFSPDGKMLATVATDGSIQLWSVSSNGQLRSASQVSDPTGAVASVTLSAGATLAASYDDGTVRLWNIHDPAAPAALATISGIPSQTAVAWEPGTPVVMGTASDGTLLTWDTDPAAVARRICDSPLASEARDLSPPPCPAGR
jgi:WD40 repeat protein